MLCYYDCIFHSIVTSTWTSKSIVIETIRNVHKITSKSNVSTLYTTWYTLRIALSYFFCCSSSLWSFLFLYLFLCTLIGDRGNRVRVSQWLKFGILIRLFVSTNSFGLMTISTWHSHWHYYTCFLSFSLSFSQNVRYSTWNIDSLWTMQTRTNTHRMWLPIRFSHVLLQQ